MIEICFRKEEEIHDSHCRQGINMASTDSYSASELLEVGKT